MESSMQIFTRQCPTCNVSVEYIHKPSFDKAEENNQQCLKCIKKYNSFYTQEYIDNLQKLLTAGLTKKEILQQLSITGEQYKYIIYKC